jgi:ubiquinone/menaquinone biosynthesis C-methylase UbiE
VTDELIAAYDATGNAWQQGPGRIYDKLATVVVGRAPALDATSLVLDLGAGTGAATRAIRRTGARAVALDASFGMLARGGRGGAACVGDASSLPFTDGVFTAVVASFSLNHLAAPVVALREAARVSREGGTLVVSAYASDDDHPAKRAVDEAARSAGWTEPSWYGELRREAMPRLSTVDRAVEVARRAGLSSVRAEVVRVRFPELTADDLVAWRLGMAHLAPFVQALGPQELSRLWRDAQERTAGLPELVRSIVVLTAGGASSQPS